MNIPFKKGDKKSFTHQVTEADIAVFESGTVHQVYSTFALARDAEWCTRLFVLEMIENDEEGIGTALSIEHLAPALVGSTVTFTATYNQLNGNELTCLFEAHVEERLIATGSTGQKILKKEKLKGLFNSI